MAGGETKVGVIIEATDNASAVLSGVQKNLTTFSGKVQSLEPAFKAMAVAGTVAFGAVSYAVKKSLDSAAEAAKVQAQLGAVLKSTGGAAGVTADAAIKLSKSLQSQTTFSDEAVLSAENMLLTFTKIKNNVFPQATETVLNMATALGTDTKEAAIQLGKALNDPILGVTALRRVGVTFNETQLDTIKSMVANNNLLGAQKLILKELATEFGGSATAKAQTFAGAMEQMNNQIDDVQESIGNALVPVLTDLLKQIAPVIAKMGEWIEKNPEMTKNILLAVGGLSLLVAGIGAVGLVLPSVIKLMEGLLIASRATWGFLMALSAEPHVAVLMAILAAIALVVNGYNNMRDAANNAVNAANEAKRIANSREFNDLIDKASGAKKEKLLNIQAQTNAQAKTTEEMSARYGGGIMGVVRSVGDYLSTPSIPATAPVGVLAPRPSTTYNFDFSGATVLDKDKLTNAVTNALSRQFTLAGQGVQ